MQLSVNWSPIQQCFTRSQLAFTLRNSIFAVVNDTLLNSSQNTAISQNQNSDYQPDKLIKNSLGQTQDSISRHTYLQNGRQIACFNVESKTSIKSWDSKTIQCNKTADLACLVMTFSGVLTSHFFWQSDWESHYTVKFTLHASNQSRSKTKMNSWSNTRIKTSIWSQTQLKQLGRLRILSKTKTPACDLTLTGNSSLCHTIMARQHHDA